MRRMLSFWRIFGRTFSFTMMKMMDMNFFRLVRAHHFLFHFLHHFHLLYMCVTHHLPFFHFSEIHNPRTVFLIFHKTHGTHGHAKLTHFLIFHGVSYKFVDFFSTDMFAIWFVIRGMWTV